MVPIFTSWDPWYSAGFGWNTGFYRGSRWGYGRYGFYDPWGYDPWGYYGYYPYDPYYDPYYTPRGYSSGSDLTPSAPRRYVGSLRIKANVKDAKVYVDGTLMGTVDEFDGLTDHLEVDAGAHELELRADGYQPLTKAIMVRVGKTMTERLKLEKK